MKPPSNSNDHRLIEAYLDQTLAAEERQAFEERLRVDNQLRAQLELQQRIDDGLGRLFPVAHASDEHIQAVAAGVAGQAGPPRAWWQSWGSAVAAAAVVTVVAMWSMGDNQKASPYFQPQPLAMVYQNTVRQGFEPYYECEDAERFAQVFETRQGQRLRLLDMPVGSHMLGLSYPGGLSRDTTAMLCDMDGQQVMVFVDRESADQPEADEIIEVGESLHVFRQVRDGLVFYEVSPFEKPRATQYLVVE